MVIKRLTVFLVWRMWLLPALLLVLPKLSFADDVLVAGPAVARVNGVDIGQQQLEYYFTDYLQAQGRVVASMRNPTVYKRLRNAALDDLIDKELLWQEAGKRALTADEQAVSAQFAAIREAFGSDEVFDRRLSEAGFDAQSFNQYLRREWVSQQVLDELAQVPPPGDEEVRAFYLAHTPRVRARHLLLRVEAGADAAAVERIRLQTEALRGRVLSGEPFADVARDYSEDKQAGEDGDLGFFTHESMVPEFAEVAFSLKTGAVSEPVRTPFGWHLISVTNDASSASVQDTQGLAVAQQALQRQRRQQANSEALQRLRMASNIQRAGGP